MYSINTQLLSNIRASKHKKPVNSWRKKTTDFVRGKKAIRKQLSTLTYLRFPFTIRYAFGICSCTTSECSGKLCIYPIILFIILLFTILLWCIYGTFCYIAKQTVMWPIDCAYCLTDLQTNFRMSRSSKNLLFHNGFCPAYSKHPNI